MTETGMHRMLSIALFWSRLPNNGSSPRACLFSLLTVPCPQFP